MENEKHCIGGVNRDLKCNCGKLRFARFVYCPECYLLMQGVEPGEAKKRAKLCIQRSRRAKYSGHYHKKNYNWCDDDPIGVKRNHLVRWLLKQGCCMKDARLIATRKYPR
jgi:hypothetical protein